MTRHDPAIGGAGQGVGTPGDHTLGRAPTSCVVRLADAAIAAECPMSCHDCGLIVAPDTVMVEAVANGLAVTPSVAVTRADGRTATIYRLPGRDR